MNDSIISMVFIGVLGLLFVLLVVLTIVLIVTRKKESKENYDEYDEEYDEAYDEAGYDEEDYEEASGEDYNEESLDEEDSSDEYYEDEIVSNNTQAEDSDDNEEVPEEDLVEEDLEEEASEEVFEKESDETSAEALDEDLAQSEPTRKIPVEEVKAAKKAASKQQQVQDTETYIDSAFAPYQENDTLSNEAIMASVKEAEAMSEALMYGKTSADAETLFGIKDALDNNGKKKQRNKSTVSSNDDFYWYNKMDVAQKPSYKTKEMYYHYFNVAKDCIDDLLVEMYDCALVRTEEIRYIAYGIEPKAVSIKDILSEGNYYYENQKKKKEPLPQDLINIYEKWCGYVDKLFDKVEVHADEYTIQEIRRLLCEFGRNDVEVLLEGK